MYMKPQTMNELRIRAIHLLDRDYPGKQSLTDYERADIYTMSLSHMKRDDMAAVLQDAVRFVLDEEIRARSQAAPIVASARAFAPSLYKTSYPPADEDIFERPRQVILVSAEDHEAIIAWTKLIREQEATAVTSRFVRDLATGRELLIRLDRIGHSCVTDFTLKETKPAPEGFKPLPGVQEKIEAEIASWGEWGQFILAHCEPS